MGVGGGTVVPALKGRGRRQRSGRASGQRSALLSRLSLLPQSPLPRTNAAWGIIESVPSPLPPWWGGGREGKSPAWGGWRRGGEMMAPTRHQETGPAAASSHAALSHSSGCDRDGGSREREKGRPLKRQQRRHRGLLGTGAREGEALLLGRKVAQGFLANWEETLSPPMGPTLFPTSVLLTPAISSSASVSQHVSFSGPMGAPK